MIESIKNINYQQILVKGKTIAEKTSRVLGSAALGMTPIIGVNVPDQLRLNEDMVNSEVSKNALTQEAGDLCDGAANCIIESDKLVVSGCEIPKSFCAFTQSNNENCLNEINSQRGSLGEYRLTIDPLSLKVQFTSDVTPDIEGATQLIQAFCAAKNSEGNMQALNTVESQISQNTDADEEILTANAAFPQISHEQPNNGVDNNVVNDSASKAQSLNIPGNSEKSSGKVVKFGIAAAATAVVLKKLFGKKRTESSDIDIDRRRVRNYRSYDKRRTSSLTDNDMVYSEAPIDYGIHKDPSPTHTGAKWSIADLLSYKIGTHSHHGFTLVREHDGEVDRQVIDAEWHDLPNNR